MKKKHLFLLTMMIIIICGIYVTDFFQSTNSDSLHSFANHDSTQNQISCEQLATVKMDSNAYVLYFDDDLIIYSVIDTGHSDQLQIYQYEMNSRSTHKLLQFTPPNMLGDPVLIDGDKLFFIDASHTFSICEMTISTGKIRTLRTILDTPMYSAISLLEEHLALLTIYPDQSNVTHYQMDTIRLHDHAIDEIKHCTYDGEIGSVIPCIYTDSSHIYIYEISIGKTNPEYFLEVCDVEGTTLSKKRLDLEEFLHVENKTSQDSIFTLVVKNNCIILNTINGRTHVLFQQNDRLTSVDIPLVLYEKIPSGYHILNNSDSNNPYVFFASDFQEPHLFCLDTVNAELLSCSFLTERSYRYITSNNLKILAQNEDDYSEYHILSCT